MIQLKFSFPLFLLLQLLLFTLVRAYTTLTDATLKGLPRPGADFDIKTGSLLAPILIPRVPGTPGSTAVLNHFVDFFGSNLPEWQLAFQNSTSKTPANGGKEVPFVNFIATRDPPWAHSGEVGRLTLVAHYDSKLFPAGFIGATDSAAPCAMLMHVARSVDEALTKKWAAMEAEGVDEFGLEEHTGLQIIFLDGEEAFISWTATDSLYGARYAVSYSYSSNPK
jgi:glutaminyl-peptide cyclotransferase